MKNQNGTEYDQNYDFVIKWLAPAFRGKTLEVIGVKTGIIEDVFGFEPADISVKTGRVDIMFRDEEGKIYHLEKQRNLRKADLYRFASQHFLTAQQWGTHVTDIILASGDVSIRDKKIKTDSGRYSPVVVDLTGRNALERLEELREAVQAGESINPMELVFLPLYGKETGEARSKTVEIILRFETELCKAQKIPPTLLAAALIMSNKFISKEGLLAIWEEIKMLDIIKIAKEKGLEEGKDIGLKEGKDIGLKEGKDIGVKEGKIIAVQEMLVDILTNAFSIIPEHVSEKIREIQNADVLKGLFRQAVKCKELQEFENVLKRVA